jgi:hypothetical protein
MDDGSPLIHFNELTDLLQALTRSQAALVHQLRQVDLARHDLATPPPSVVPVGTEPRAVTPAIGTVEPSMPIVTSWPVQPPVTAPLAPTHPAHDYDYFAELDAYLAGFAPPDPDTHSTD